MSVERNGLKSNKGSSSQKVRGFEGTASSSVNSFPRWGTPPTPWRDGCLSKVIRQLEFSGPYHLPAGSLNCRYVELVVVHVLTCS